jgi:hypothetical protein
MIGINTVRATVVAAAVAAGVLGFGIASASAQPAPPPPPGVGEPAPAWAPKKPAEVWAGQPVVWTSAWGGRWGVWINGGFIPLSSNPVTGGG